MVLAVLLLVVAHARVVLNMELRRSVEQVQPKDALPFLLPRLAQPAHGFQVRSDQSTALARQATQRLRLRGGSDNSKPSGFDKLDPPRILRPYDPDDAYALSTVLEPKSGVASETTSTPVPTAASLSLIEKSIAKPVPKYLLKGMKMTWKLLEKWCPRLVASIAASRLIFMPIRLTPSLSMYPTFEQNDVVAVDKVSKWWSPLKRGEVLLFKPPPNFWVELPDVDPHHGKKVRMIKRVVAVAGDTIEMKGGVLYVNDEPQHEPFILGPAEYEMPKQKVPEKSLFVLGDNRNESFDSHIWGFLPTNHVIGRATMHDRPLIRIGPIEGQQTWDNAKGALEAKRKRKAEGEAEAELPTTGADTLSA